MKLVSNHLSHFFCRIESNPIPPYVELNEYKPAIVELQPITTIPESDKIMLEVLQEYLPYERNAGLIPIDFEERVRMYPETFRAFKRYIPDEKWPEIQRILDTIE